jgi:AraC-like DNA-binding protein
MTFIIMNPFQLDVFCLLVPHPPARQQARKNCNLFHNGTAETNLGDLSVYLSKAYFVCSGNAPDIQNQILIQITTNIDEPLNEHVRKAVEMLDADIAHNFKIKNLSSSIGISRSHLTSLSNAAFGLPPYQRLLQRRLDAARRPLQSLPLSPPSMPVPWGWRTV